MNISGNKKNCFDKLVLSCAYLLNLSEILYFNLSESFLLTLPKDSNICAFIVIIGTLQTAFYLIIPSEDKLYWIEQEYS